MRVYEQNYADKAFFGMSVGWNEVIELSMMSYELVDLLQCHIQSSLVSHNIEDEVKALLAQMSILRRTLKETLVRRDISEKRSCGRELRRDEILFGGLRGRSFDACCSELDFDKHRNGRENVSWLRGGTMQYNSHMPTPSTALKQTFTNEWKVGDRVECMLWGDWVPARVTRVLACHIYAVQFDSRKMERIVYAYELRAITRSNVTTSSNDTALPCPYPSFEPVPLWNPTTRHASEANNARTINASVDDTFASDSGDCWEIESMPNFESFPECANFNGTTNTRDNLLPYLARPFSDNRRSQASNLLEQPKWKVGDCVEVITFDDSYFSCWLPGQIAHVYLIDVEISAYRVQLDNGTIRDCVVPSMLRTVHTPSNSLCNNDGVNTDRDMQNSAHLSTCIMPLHLLTTEILPEQQTP